MRRFGKRGQSVKAESLESRMLLTATLGDYVWVDSDGDGQQDNGEPGLNGVDVELTGAGLDGMFFTVDDTFASGITMFDGVNDGAYSFANLAPGLYTVTFLPFLDSINNIGYTRTAENIGPDATDSDANVGTGITQIIALIDGETNNTIDAGYTTEAAIGNFVWNDLNANGIQNTLEPGIPNATVNLKNNLGTVIRTTTTDADGMYWFTNVPAGAYSVQFVHPAGYSNASPPNNLAEGDDTLDSDADPTSGMTETYQIAAAEFNDTIDAGYYNILATATISGTKYEDLTGNGLSVDDTPLGGTVIKLYADTNLNGIRDAGDGAAVATATTAALTGVYSFNVTTLGLYFVEEVVPAGFVRTAPTFFNYIPVNVAASDTYAGNNFANFELCDLSRLSNVTYVINGTTTVTNLRGNVNQGDTVRVNFSITAGATAHQYSLVSYTAPSPVFIAAESGLQQVFDSATGVFGPGSWSMTIVVPNCYFQVDFVCGDILTTLGPEGSNLYYTPQGRLISADNDGTQACAPSTLSGYVYLDANNNGVQNTGETGIANVTVTLTGMDIYGTAVTRTAMTNSSGYYVFSNLKASKASGYTLTESQPASYLDGKDAIGSQGGTTGNDVLTTKRLNTNTSGINNNFGELPLNYTKFYVVNSATTDRTYEYKPTGALVESYLLNSGNTNPRGVTTTAAGTKTWVIDANRKVFVYNTSGGLLGSWTAGSLPSGAVVEDITTNGTDVWLVDAKGCKVYKYAAAASRLSGSQNAASSFALNSGNTNARGIVTDGTSLWTVNDSTTNKVFKYSINGTFLGSWTIAAENAAPSGIAINPADVNHVWIVDSSTCKVYQYSDAATRLSGSQSVASVFGLASGNTAPQGIADPPPLASSAVAADQNMTTRPAASSNGPMLNRVASLATPLTRTTTEAGRRDLQRSAVSPLAVGARHDLPAHGFRNSRAPLLASADLPVRSLWWESPASHTSGHTPPGDVDALFADWEADPLELLAASLSKRTAG